MQDRKIVLQNCASLSKGIRENNAYDEIANTTKKKKRKQTKFTPRITLNGGNNQLGREKKNEIVRDSGKGLRSNNNDKRQKQSVR